MVDSLVLYRIDSFFFVESQLFAGVKRNFLIVFVLMANFANFMLYSKRGKF